MIDKAMTIRRDKLGSVIGRLDGEVMVEVERRLAIFLGIAKYGKQGGLARRPSAAAFSVRRQRSASRRGSAAPSSPRSHSRPVMICRASRATGASRCSSVACLLQAG